MLQDDYNTWKAQQLCQVQKQIALFEILPLLLLSSKESDEDL